MINLWNDIKLYSMLANIWVSKQTSKITDDMTAIFQLIFWGTIAFIMYL